jgi:integrase
MRVFLTDRFCDRAAKPQGGDRTDYFDAEVNGLALRVTDERKSWTFSFTSPRNGKRARLTFGTYPATTLAAARARALEAKGHVEVGRDPRDVFAAEEPGAMTVGMLIESYLAKHVRPNRRSAEGLERRFTKSVTPVIGSLRLADLHRRDVNRVLDPIIARGSPIEAAHVFKELRAMLRWAAGRGDIDHNPIDGMKQPAHSRPRERVLTDDEIRTVWRALPTALAGFPNYQRIIRLCLITAQRIGEVAGMARGELALERRLWLLPGSRTKNSHPHAVPLSDMALEVISEAKGEALFGSPTPGAVGRAIEGLYGRLGMAHWTSHDLRRTALTGMGMLGVSPFIRGHVANHHSVTKAGVTLGVYDAYEYEAEKREALDLWGARLAGIISGAAEVVPMRRIR